MKTGWIIVFLIALSLFGASMVNAQLFESAGVILRINPEYPKTNSEVTATVSASTVNIGQSKISWFLDGNLSSEGIGKKNFTFTTGGTGTRNTLEVKVETTNGGTINKQMLIEPVDIDLLWEPQDSYIPPFYKGKKIGSSESSFKIVAIPNAKNSIGFIYNWKLDGTVKQGSSGYEKNYYIFKKSYLDRDNTVEVTVTDLLGKKIGSGSVTIKTDEPEIIFYEKDPVFGTRWEKALSDGHQINQEGTTIVAEPFFFSLKNLNSSDLEMNWYINGEEQGEKENYISLKPENDKSGTANIKIFINNIKTLFQSANKELNVSF